MSRWRGLRDAPAWFLMGAAGHLLLGAGVIIFWSLPLHLRDGFAREALLAAGIAVALVAGGQHLLSRAAGQPPRTAGSRTERLSADMRRLATVDLSLRVVALSLGVALLVIGGEWLWLNLAFAMVVGYVMTPLHELGHLGMAWATGLTPLLLKTGGAWQLPRFRWRGIDVVLGVPPWGGFVLVSNDRTRWRRLRFALMTLAGPAVNALAVGAAMALREPSIVRGFAPVWALLIANASTLVMNLVPRTGLYPLGRSANDGLTLLRTIRSTKEQAARRSPAPWLLLAFERLSDHDARGAESAISAAAERGEAAIVAHARGYLELSENDPLAARGSFLAALDAPGASLSYLAMCLNNIAWSDALSGSPELRDEADCYSMEAFAFDACPSFKGTRGFVLAWLGRHDEGLALMREAQTERASALGSAALALAHIWRGGTDEAAEEIAAARRLDPRCELIPRLERELSGVRARRPLA